MRLLVAILLGLLAAKASALTINPMLQNSMVLQKNVGDLPSLINGTASTGATVSIYWPCPDPTFGAACPIPPVYSRTLESNDQNKWFFNLSTGDYTDLSTVTSTTSGARLRIVVTDDLNNATTCVQPSGYLVNGATIRMTTTNVTGVIGPVGTCTIDITGVLVGENWLCSGQSALVPAYVGHTCRAGGDPPQMCSIWPAIRGNTEEDFVWTSLPDHLADVSASCFWLATELQSKLQAPIGAIQRAYGATGIKRWEGDSICEDPEMFNIINNVWNGSCSNHCTNGDVCLTDDDCTSGTCNYVPGISDPPHQTNFGAAWGDLYGSSVWPMWPFGIRGVYWFQGLNDSGDDANYRHSLPSLARSWRRDRNNITAQIGGLPLDDLAMFWVQNTPKGSGADRCTECSPDTNIANPDRSLSNTEPMGPPTFAELQNNEFDDPMHAAYVTGYYGEATGGCRRLSPMGFVTACSGIVADTADGEPVVPSINSWMIGATDLEQGLHPKNTQPYGRRIAEAAMVKLYGFTALQPGFSNSWSGPNLIGMRLGTPGGGILPVNLCFQDQTAEEMFGMRIPGVSQGPYPEPYVLNGFSCWEDGASPEWQFAPALINGTQIIVDCPMETPQLIKYDKSRFEGPHVLFGNVFNGDTQAMPSFIVDVADNNLDECLSVETPTPIPTPTGPTLTPTPTHTAGATNTPTETPVLSACMTELLGIPDAIAGFHFDETEGSLAYDNVDGFDGTYTDSVVLDQPSLLFNDTNASAQFGDTSAMNIISASGPDFFPVEQSVIVFAKTSDPSAQLFNQQDSAGVTTRFSITMVAGKVRFTAGVGVSCTPTYVESVLTYDDGLAHMIVAVFNSSEQLELYVDNEAVVQSFTSLGALCPTLASGVVAVGSNADLSAFSDAFIDEPRIYGNGLTSGDVSSLAALCVEVNTPTPTRTPTSTPSLTRTPTQTLTPTSLPPFFPAAVCHGTAVSTSSITATGCTTTRPGIIVAVNLAQTVCTLPAATDSESNTYVLDRATVTGTSGQPSTYVFSSIPAAADLTAGTITFTCGSGSFDTGDLRAMQASNIHPADAAANSSGFSNAPVCALFNTLPDTLLASTFALQGAGADTDTVVGGSGYTTVGQAGINNGTKDIVSLLQYIQVNVLGGWLGDGMDSSASRNYSAVQVSYPGDTRTPTETPTATLSATPTSSATATPSPTVTNTAKSCKTLTPSLTPTGTGTQLPTVTATPTPTRNPLLCCECPSSDCVEPIMNECPTPCTAITPAICNPGYTATPTRTPTVTP